MTGSTGADVADLVTAALEVYEDDSAATAVLQGYALRLREPLRVAFAGMVKAGKSTLLNACIGEEIAPTDTGECTRVVTWYRYGDTPRVTLHPQVGEPRNLPVKRADGRLVLDMGDTPARDVRRLVVDWPVQSLRDLTLIDTPGIASVSADVSARTTDFLTPQDAPADADAVIYLLRHLHASDLRFLESFEDTGSGRSGTVNALAVLSRADEVGAGRIDALISARTIAERYGQDPRLRSMALAVVPVAGLMAQSARTLRQSEFTALAGLAALDRPARERLLLSADRFVRPQPDLSPGADERAALLDRFGLFGIRMATALLRGGITEPTDLSRELVRRSGLDDLLDLTATHFRSRALALRGRSVLMGVEALVRQQPRAGTEELTTALERLLISAHEHRELRLLAALRTTGLALSGPRLAEAERLIGGEGTDPVRRLGLPEGSGPDTVRAEARSQLRRWRTLAESPLSDPSVVRVCEVVVRSCEAIASQAGRQRPSTRQRLSRGGAPPGPWPGARSSALES